MEQKFFMRGDAHHHLGETHVALLRSASHAVTLSQHLVRKPWPGGSRSSVDLRSEKGDALIQSAEVAHAGSIAR